MNQPVPVMTPTSPGAASRAALARLRRPDRRLLHYYLLQSLLAGPGVVFVAPFRYFRYRSLRYVFDDEGITMRWGILFRREITLTYARIQDIHLVSNIVERWLGLGRVQIQTASGSATAEITIEGLLDYETLRDDLYLRMRGARGETGRGSVVEHSAASEARAWDALLAGTRNANASMAGTRNANTSLAGTHDAEVVAALAAATAELRALREELGRGRVP